jgi:hypothetical protein
MHVVLGPGGGGHAPLAVPPHPGKLPDEGDAVAEEEDFGRFPARLENAARREEGGKKDGEAEGRDAGQDGQAKPPERWV